MSQAEPEPPAKKIGPEHIEGIMDNRSRYGYAQFTAGKLAEVIVETHDNIDELNAETVRRHLKDLVEDDSSDIERFELGRRTVVYGKANDAEMVADGGLFFSMWSKYQIPFAEAISLLFIGILVSGVGSLLGLISAFYFWWAAASLGVLIGFYVTSRVLYTMLAKVKVRRDGVIDLERWGS